MGGLARRRLFLVMREGRVSSAACVESGVEGYSPMGKEAVQVPRGQGRRWSIPMLYLQVKLYEFVLLHGHLEPTVWCRMSWSVKFYVQGSGGNVLSRRGRIRDCCLCRMS